MNANLNPGALMAMAGLASWLSCAGGTGLGNKMDSGPGTGGTADAAPGAGGTTGADAVKGVGGATGAGLAGSSGQGTGGGTGVGAGGALGLGGSRGGSGGGGGIAVGGTGGGGTPGPIKVLIWNNAVTYGHQSRITAIPLLQARETTDNLKFDLKYAHTTSLPEGQVDASSDPSVFTDAGLDPYDVVFFLNTTGNTMDQDGQASTHRQALINFIGKGRGFVGTHSATDTYQGTAWTWYVDFIGANFSSHSNAGTPGIARYDPSMTHAILTAANPPNPWSRSEEWYAFTRDPLSSAIPGIKILLICTDNTITTERPSAWVHEMPLVTGAARPGRMFYTGFGHFAAAFQEKSVMDLVVAGIKWAAYRL